MFVDKIREKQSGLLLYGITPPKVGTDASKIENYGIKTVERVNNMNIDALVIYDVQDESERIEDERPFPFLSALDPLYFAEKYLYDAKVSKIMYRPAGKYTPNELGNWIQRVALHGFSAVFVGVPSPTHVPKTSLPETYELVKKLAPKTNVGGVIIPERHAELRDEDERVMSKVKHGVTFFVSQCVFHVGYAKDVIASLIANSNKTGQEIPTIIFTLTSCGSAKTLSFIEWLGIYIPDEIKHYFLSSSNILEASVGECIKIANELADYCVEKNIRFGFNIESVAIKKDEIEASLRLVDEVDKILKNKGLR
jgi:hypothetical protein